MVCIGMGHCWSCMCFDLYDPSLLGKPWFCWIESFHRLGTNISSVYANSWFYLYAYPLVSFWYVEKQSVSYFVYELSTMYIL